MVLQLEVLVFKHCAIDRLTASAVSCCKVPTLAHELRYDSVKHTALEVQWLATISLPLLPCNISFDVK